MLHGLLAGNDAVEEADIGRVIQRLPPLGREILPDDYRKTPDVCGAMWRTPAAGINGVVADNPLTRAITWIRDKPVVQDAIAFVNELVETVGGMLKDAIPQAAIDAVRDVFFVSSTAMLVRSDLFAELGRSVLDSMAFTP